MSSNATTDRSPAPISARSASPKSAEQEFVRRLRAGGVTATVRDTRGREIAGDGQRAAGGPAPSIRPPLASGMTSYAVTVQRVNSQGKLALPNTTPTAITCSGTSWAWRADLGSSSRRATYRITVAATDVAGNTGTTHETIYA